MQRAYDTVYINTTEIMDSVQTIDKHAYGISFYSFGLKTYSSFEFLKCYVLWNKTHNVKCSAYCLCLCFNGMHVHLTNYINLYEYKIQLTVCSFHCHEHTIANLYNHIAIINSDN